MNAKVEKVKPTKLDINAVQKVQYCIPIWLRDEQIKHAISRVKGRIQPHYEERTDSVAVVCFGPSLYDTWEQLKDFKYIITCSGSHKFLVDRDITPTWHIEVDPRAHKVQLIGQPRKETEYLISSTCHPKVFDHLEGYNVKLWHVFDGEEDAMRTLPQGEWALFGGSSVGLRALTIARFLGFKDLHVFGMDGCEGKTGKHADKHPNQPKDSQECEYGGVVYKTTASMLECAKQTWHELDQMPDVKATFYGEGLVQAMSKNYIPKTLPKGTPTIGYHKQELISPEVKELNARLHRENLSYGVGGKEHVEIVVKLAESIKAESIGDYGCGKGLLAKHIGRPIWEYDPCVPGKEEQLRPVDLLVCTDVLEHVEPDKLASVLDDMRRCVKRVGYFVINTKPAIKTYADGRNTHLLVKDKHWWETVLSKFFKVGKIENVGGKLQIIVGPKPKDKIAETSVAADSITKVGNVSFYTPNQATKWRANTLLIKEPITIQWINSMKEGDVLYDVGANVGGYTILAGAKGVNVFSFEPEAENYSLLMRNILLNNHKSTAFCMAISKASKVGTLNLSQIGAGGSCHMFGDPQDKFIHQGCLAMSLDELLAAGLPQPTHIKIDVDGLEADVIHGATEVLKKVDSILVEINTSLPNHVDLVKHLKDNGFTYSQEQVDAAIRKEGNFKGVAEFLFTKESAHAPSVYSNVSVDRVIAEKINKAKVMKYPTPYIFIENIFPEELYQDILSNLPDNYVSIETVRQLKGYKERLVSIPESFFWKDLDSKLRTGFIRNALCTKFGVSNDFIDETLLIRDLTGYKIGPHTDSLAKVISALFYLPSDESQLEAGTSLYLPKDKNFRCVGGPHHKFEYFDKITTVPFKPNSLFAFLKTDTSFHGVELYTGSKPRDVLLYDIRKG